MKLNMKNMVTLALSVTFSLAANAEGVKVEKSQAEIVLQAAIDNFTKLVPIPIVAIEESPLPNMVQVVTEKGVFYATKDGKYIVAGNVHEAKEGLPNLTKARLAKENGKKIAELKDSFITYKAENETSEIVVFYDTSCAYCTKFHNEVEDFNQAGVTVHYAAWPRQGVYNQQNKTQYTGAYYKLENVWCAENPKAALDAAAHRANVPRSTCENTIPEQFALGLSLGVSGTPAIFSIDGQLVQRGYAPVDVLIKNLKGVN
ncbi:MULTISPECIES: thioredoxin fold domain-containing protein [unclassified Pseudoalteromonas]|uniref:thioredoxin fold domain-containing protein n=1 Tax=unclassified Pseudoalteromonas TaxID=194690 RepID=UPI001603B7A2|nr:MULTISPECIES: thioredoxin fold domain-containing protein [unclassified Pseudoalteromonas]MBB1294970.1 thioredoxin fold domain-containing protein [Pseudoalteromonas sp. SR41-4]MBB1410869.1 thioredoxin fold domain-containing protein [Pseudoalteromonas sp. SG44-17]